MLNSTPENPTKRHYADLYAREHERATALRAIRAASSEIARSQNFKGTLELVMKKAAETLPMDAGALFLFDEKTQRFETAVSHNLSQERISRITFAFNEGVPGWVVTHRQPLIINDASQDQRVHPCVVADGVMCVLAVPLLTHDHVVGVLNLFCQTTQGAFDDEALLLAQVYADQAAIFIQNARLMDGLREATTELERRVEERTRQLVQTQAQVLRAEKMAAVGRLASSVAHEVNNPLQAVALHLELVADDALTPVAQDSLNLVQLELDRIAHIVQRLLDFQRPKHGKQTLQTVSTLLDAVLTLAQKQLQRTCVKVVLDIESGICPVLVVGDQIKQVFLNLLLNAIDAMPQGGELRVTAVSTLSTVVVQFQDSGVGMQPEVLTQLFEPFFTTKHDGSGLGLAVSHEIVANHGGTLEAESKLGEGSTFIVTLPIG